MWLWSSKALKQRAQIEGCNKKQDSFFCKNSTAFCPLYSIIHTKTLTFLGLFVFQIARRCRKMIGHIFNRIKAWKGQFSEDFRPPLQFFEFIILQIATRYDLPRTICSIPSFCNRTTRCRNHIKRQGNLDSRVEFQHHSSCETWIRLPLPILERQMFGQFTKIRNVDPRVVVTIYFSYQ